MAQKIFKTLYNHSAVDVSVNGNTVAAQASQLIFLNPKFLANNLGDVVSLYTQQLIDLYDDTDTLIASDDVWDSINYNINALSSVSAARQPTSVYAQSALSTYAVVNEEYLHLIGGEDCAVTVDVPYDGQELKIVNHNPGKATFGAFTITSNTSCVFRFCANAWVLLGRFPNA